MTINEDPFSEESMTRFGFDAGRDDALAGRSISVDPVEDGQSYTEGYLAGYASASA